jgi:hypothetical protein
MCSTNPARQWNERTEIDEKKVLTWDRNVLACETKVRTGRRSFERSPRERALKPRRGGISGAFLNNGSIPSLPQGGDAAVTQRPLSQAQIGFKIRLTFNGDDAIR